MSEQRDSEFTTERPNARLSRRSLAAALAIVGTLGPAAASRAMAGSSPKPPKWFPHYPRNPGGGHGGEPSHKCFLSGTRLLTPSGEVAIEALNVGDLLVTESGQSRAIRWIGVLEFLKSANGTWEQGVLPIRIAKGALGIGCPQRDTYVSGAHMLYLNGVLIAAACLINGRTISVATPDVETLQYFHIEFDRHDVVMAEGMPCESLLASDGGRQTFDNYDEYVGRYGHLREAAMTPYAPIASFNGGRSELRSRLRSALSPVIDLRYPVDVVRDHVEARAILGMVA
jgi:hypothetical protein